MFRTPTRGIVIAEDYKYQINRLRQKYGMKVREQRVESRE
jgi:hypothetical protein